MKTAIYAGSFDPWSFGHQYVLESGLGVFDCVHVLAALNPAKSGTLESADRVRLIAHASDPFEDWWRAEPPFHIGKRMVVAFTSGLVVDYAREHGINHLLRGLRSTSDFEAEFNLYFSNRAILPSVQAWTIMCPPELLHCSSTYVRTVVGKPGVPFVGTSFLAQSAMLGRARCVGDVFDLVQACSKERFEAEPADLEGPDLNAGLQAFFTRLAGSLLLSRLSQERAQADLREFRRSRSKALKASLAQRRYPSEDVAGLWALLVRALCADPGDEREKWETLGVLEGLAGELGKTNIPLLPRKAIEERL